MKQAHGNPTRKVSAGIITDALVLLVVMLCNQYFLTDNPIPAEAAVLASTILGGLASYLVPPSASDGVVRDTPAPPPGGIPPA